MFTREYQLKKLKETSSFDVVVIGGGASGLGVAVDAASRGLKVALFEAYDFAKGTSSRSTKLVHGGVRYLAQGNIKLVMEALKERGLLSKNANHLFKKQSFLIPSYSWWHKYFYGIGLIIYDLLSMNLSIGSSKIISKKTALEMIFTLKSKNLVGGVTYFDGQFDDARLALNLAQTAEKLGVTILNYCKVNAFILNDNQKINAVTILQKEANQSITVHCKVVVNATGVFSNKILKLSNQKEKAFKIVPSQGIHLVLENSFLSGTTALMIPKTSDGRVLFVIPWHGKVVVGTTDTLIKKPLLEPKPLEEEIDFILQNASNYLTKQPTRNDVLSVFSGLRPLVAVEGDKSNTKEISRGHKIIHSENGLVSIVGGKWTTYRAMSEDVVNDVVATYGFKVGASKTESMPIHGSFMDKNHDSPPEHLWYYGTDAIELQNFTNTHASFKQLIHPKYSFTTGQVIWAIQHEMARNIEDILARRLRLLFLDAKAAIECSEIVGEILKKELHKDLTWKDNQVAEFKALANNYILKI